MAGWQPAADFSPPASPEPSQTTALSGLLHWNQSMGDAAVFDQHRGLLLSIAYRMLGSWADAEDIVQEAFLRWQQSAEAEVRSPRSFLVTIVSRLCINHLQSAQVRREEYFGEWLPEPVVADADDPGEVEESLSMAFLVLLERLNPVEIGRAH